MTFLLFRLTVLVELLPCVAVVACLWGLRAIGGTVPAAQHVFALCELHTGIGWGTQLVRCLVHLAQIFCFL